MVIGIHSAKFEGEGVTDNIRQIVQRYGLKHPVANDVNFEVWQSYSARAWPSLYILDPLGMVVGRIEGESVNGEGIADFFIPIIETMIDEYGAAGLLNTTPLQLSPELENLTDTALSFPGKVLVDEVGQRFFISDSGHNRIVVTDLTNFEVL